jgi:tetraacyldisaccharide 4'-kinase
VGNLSVGGSGKTPMVEYLIRLLNAEKGITVISRGYKRKQKGSIIANASHTAYDIGDEAKQYIEKFPDIELVLDANREKAVKLSKSENIIIFDDAFQHRRITAGLNIVLTDYFSPFYKDTLLPVGNLREGIKSKKRADIIIITKCPTVLSPITRNDAIKQIKPSKDQKVYFAYTKHHGIKTFEGEEVVIDKRFLNHFVAVTGIHNNYRFFNYLRKISKDIEVFEFPDHHFFTKKDLEKIRKHYLNYYSNHKYLICTEKDFMRLKDSPYFSIIKDLNLCYVAITMEFHEKDKILFNQQIQDYVRQNQKNI